jgi:hypothetical protein
MLIYMHSLFSLPNLCFSGARVVSGQGIGFGSIVWQISMPPGESEPVLQPELREPPPKSPQGADWGLNARLPLGHDQISRRVDESGFGDFPTKPPIISELPVIVMPIGLDAK